MRCSRDEDAAVVAVQRPMPELGQRETLYLADALAAKIHRGSDLREGGGAGGALRQAKAPADDLALTRRQRLHERPNGFSLEIVEKHVLGVTAGAEARAGAGAGDVV